MLMLVLPYGTETQESGTKSALQWWCHLVDSHMKSTKLHTQHPIPNRMGNCIATYSEKVMGAVREWYAPQIFRFKLGRAKITCTVAGRRARATAFGVPAGDGENCGSGENCEHQGGGATDGTSQAPPAVRKPVRACSWGASAPLPANSKRRRHRRADAAGEATASRRVASWAVGRSTCSHQLNRPMISGPEQLGPPNLQFVGPDLPLRRVLIGTDWPGGGLNQFSLKIEYKLAQLLR